MILALVLLPPNPVDEAIGLYNGWRDRNPVHEYRMQIRSGQFPAVASQFRLDWNRKWTYYRSNDPSYGNYELSFTSRGWLDLDHDERQFDELPLRPEMGLRPSRISGIIQGTFPVFLYTGQLRSLLPSQANPQRKDGSFQGKPSMELTARQGDAKAAEEYRATINIAPDGTLQRIALYSRSPMSPTSDREWIFQESRPLPEGDAPFMVAIPPDYTPYALSDPGPPIPAGEKPQLTGWMRDGREVDLAKETAGKMALIAVLTPDEPTSAWGRSIAESVAKSGLATYVLSDSGKAFPGAPYYNPSPNALDDLNPPSTPFFYLLDKSGKIQALWMGATKDGIEARAKEILAESKRTVGE